MLAGVTACAQTARGVAQDTKDNTSAVRGAVETVDVKTAIIADKTIDSGAIDVDTYRGTVQLSGFVDSKDVAERATKAAGKVSGVKSLKNDLRVKSPS